jgi:hypothetical protein
MRTITRYVACAAAASLALSTACGPSVPVSTAEVIAVPVKALPVTPDDSVWEDAPVHIAKLVLQDLVEPRLMELSTPEVHVRAVTSGSEIAFRLEWRDSTTNDLARPGHFSDGCAVQVPSKIEASVPAPQMGEVGKPVEITYWRADWQASVDGREDSVKAAYPHASVDHYPSEAPSLEKGSQEQKEMETRYSPAAAAGNRRVGPRDAPTEDLVAEGPGTLAPAGHSGSRGRGMRTDKGWSVIIVRPLPNGLSPQSRSQIAFAVWEGSHGETGARKMRTGWVPLMMKAQE